MVMIPIHCPFMLVLEDFFSSYYGIAWISGKFTFSGSYELVSKGPGNGGYFGALISG